MNADKAINQVIRTNALLSEQMGIGVSGSDALENLSTKSSNYYGSKARKILKELDIVKRIITSPPKDALRNGFTIKTNHEELNLGELIFERLKTLDHRKKLLRYGILGRLYNRGVLMFPVLQESEMMNNREHLNNKLVLSNIEKIESINIIDEDYFSYQTQISDPLARDFGEIRGMYVNSGELDPSRYNLEVKNLDIYTQQGISVLQGIVRACFGINVAEWTIEQLMLKYKSMYVKYPASEVSSTNIKKKDALRSLINDIKNKFTSKSVTAIPDNYQFEISQVNFTGIKEATEFLYEFLSSTSNVAQSIIKGTAKGELASSEKDQRDYYEYVKSDEQETVVEPALQFLIPMIVHEKKGEIRPLLEQHGIDPASITSDVEFNPLQSVNPLQDSQIKLLDTQAAAIGTDKDMISSQEGREAVFTDIEGATTSSNENDDSDFNEVIKDIMGKIGQE